MLRQAKNHLLKRRTDAGSFTSLNRMFSDLAAIKRGEERDQPELKIGDTNHNFELMSKEYFKDFDITLFKFKHKNLGTVHYHIDTADTNNCFSFNFTTIPEDSTGKMHILEHLALCGSKKFPVRDPFMNMLRRSLSTFMNAWTGPDFTSYPYSTVNAKDFYNLLDVYSESVFNPLLRKTDFMQEGWRYEFENREDPNSKLKIMGVVYNEMKGVYENPDNLFMEGVQSNLLKGTPYSYDSGGRPAEVPKLTHEDLVDYHKRNYHPSNATIFTYGDLNVIKHQEFLENNFLKNYTRYHFTTPSMIPSKPETRRVTLKKPPPAVSIKEGWDTYFAVSFLCNPIGTDPEDIIGLSILTQLLFEYPKSPFYTDILETGLADEYCPGNGYESNIAASFFTIGFKNIERGTEKKLEEKIFDILEKTANEGIDKGMIESSLHQIELSSKVVKSNFGLQIFQSYLGAINHGEDSILNQGLNITKVLEEIRKKANEGYFENLIKKYFLKNEHRLYITMESDANYNAELEKNEKEYIERIEKNLTKEQRKNIVKDAMQLVKEQETVQDLNVLPSLKIQDIPTGIEPTIFHKEDIDGIPTFFFHKPTNGLTYFRLKVDLSQLDHSVIYDLYLMSILLPNLGTKQNSYEEFQEQLDLYTSGFGLTINYEADKANHDVVKPYALFSISCLDRNIGKMFELLAEIITEPDFKDHEHISNQVRQFSSKASSALVEKPLEYAIDYGTSSHRKSQQFYSKLYLNRYLCNFGTNLQKSNATRKIYLEEMEYSISYIFNKIFKRKNVSYSVHTASSNIGELKSRLSNFTNSLKTNLKRFDIEDPYQDTFDYRPEYFKDYFMLPTQTNYATETFFTPGYLHKDSTKLEVLSDLLARGELHKLIREKGGAYGGGSQFNALAGAFSFFSYRDPHSISTLDNFAKAVKWVTEGNITQEDVDSAKLTLFSKIDRPVPPHNHGMKLFLHNLSDEELLERRGRILDVNKQDLEEAVQNYFVEQTKNGHSSKVIFGSSSIDQDALQKQGWNIEDVSTGLKLKKKLNEVSDEDLDREYTTI